LIAASENATNDPVTKNCRRVRVKSLLEYTQSDKLTNTCFLIPGFPTFAEKDSRMFTTLFGEVPFSDALGLVGIGLLRNRVQEKERPEANGEEDIGP
jgi:hypothetical protein